ncbi:ATP-binding protein [uncultured Methylovirgula sp.]|uniref:ATP-binding protein n=1 Tax=uncultured Methylovirgula sp. TaxID=1285960 RepID=UPI0026287FA6|nr:ATP-binding protein [uncultured Methylovirgula sp.]
MRFSSNPRHWSIAARLFVSAAVLSSIILLIAGIGLSAIYRKSAETRFDERLGFYLRALVADIAAPSEENRSQPFELGEPQFEIPLSGWYWQITRLDSTGSNIQSSRSLFAARLAQLPANGVPAGVGGARSGYIKGPDDKLLRMVERTIDTGDEGIYLVQVAATTAPMESEVAGFELALIVTFTLLAAALVGSAALQMRYGLEPLRRLQEGVAAIRQGQGERVGGEFPQDIAPLAAEVNLLLDANREVVERARTQVGNLAHALKTPLSVIINEAATEKTPLSFKVREQAAIMRDQVTYYLDRARAAVRVGAIGNMAEVAPVTAGLVRTFEKIYRDRGITFSAQVPDNIRFRGERQDLEEMIGNLVDNAGKWARQNVTIVITPIAASNPQAKKFFRVVIDDDGVGLAPELREAAMRRGRRLDETRPGSGLGLSIVVDLAALYGGALRLDASPAGGLRAELELPAAA